MSRDDRAKKRGGANEQPLGPRLIHMAHNREDRRATESEGSEEEGGMAEEAARLQREMDAHMSREIELGVERRLREKRERSAQTREERERSAQAAATPRRAGPPAPGTATTPASEQGKRLHSVMQNLW